MYRYLSDGKKSGFLHVMDCEVSGSPWWYGGTHRTEKEESLGHVPADRAMARLGPEYTNE